jgi:peptidoglycan/LPS O-acetylase OafA/YrhL
MGEWEVERFVPPRTPKHRCSFPASSEFGIGSIARCPDCNRRWRRTPEGWTRLLSAAQRRRHMILVALFAIAIAVTIAAIQTGWQVVALMGICMATACIVILVASTWTRRVPVEPEDLPHSGIWGRGSR